MNFRTGEMKRMADKEQMQLIRTWVGAGFYPAVEWGALGVEYSSEDTEIYLDNIVEKHGWKGEWYYSDDKDALILNAIRQKWIEYLKS